MDNSRLQNSHNISNDPKYLYLDQNMWISLGRGHYRKEIDRDLSCILSKIKNFVDCK